MEAITPDLTKPLGFARKGMFLGRLAEGVSQPPWSWRVAGGAVLVSFAGFLGLPQYAMQRRAMGCPMSGASGPPWFGLSRCCARLAYLTRQAGTTVGKVFGLRGARVGPVLVSGLLLFILETALDGWGHDSAHAARV